jgi:hypothetical protein
MLLTVTNPASDYFDTLFAYAVKLINDDLRTQKTVLQRNIGDEVYESWNTMTAHQKKIAASQMVETR